MMIRLMAMLASALMPTGAQAMFEEERLVEYHKRNYTWPVQKFVPDTEGWKQLMESRLRQVQEIENQNKRYEGYLQTIQAAVVAPNFTEHGFGLARAPDELMEALREGIRKGVEDGPGVEGDVEVIEGLQPWFIDRPDLTQRVLNELQHFPEEWAGMELTPFRAYGFRLYRNQSNLHMHIDKSQTHVISFILHIDSSDDAEPWPIVIEDFEGKTHEVVLTSGDILFYESSKCFHGRPSKFNGSWYSSVFVHYYPKEGWAETDHTLEKNIAVPPIWNQSPTTKNETPLQMLGTGMKEPSCPNEWCRTQDSIKWSGPGTEGYWIAPNMEKYPFQPKELECKDYTASCNDWVKWDTDECERNSKYMKIHCKKSCGICDPSSTTGDEL